MTPPEPTPRAAAVEDLARTMFEAFNESTAEWGNSLFQKDWMNAARTAITILHPHPPGQIDPRLRERLANESEIVGLIAGIVDKGWDEGRTLRRIAQDILAEFPHLDAIQTPPVLPTMREFVTIYNEASVFHAGASPCCDCLINAMDAHGFLAREDEPATPDPEKAEESFDLTGYEYLIPLSKQFDELRSEFAALKADLGVSRD